jgi:hypothetical protein
MNRIGLVWQTVRHLTGRQLAYQLLNRLRPRPRLHLPQTVTDARFLVVPPADKPRSWAADTFTFLNEPVHMPLIDWNYAGHGKLWTYNLNYFDFLNQPLLSLNEGLGFIRQFMARTADLRDGLEPYPTSLRLVNWIQFLSRHQYRDEAINRHLYAQAQLLSRRLEYHLAGNHLLENGLALLTAALYFGQPRWLTRASILVRAELNRQILPDGGHDERSPMYHQLLLDRLLDVVLALKHETWPDALGYRDYLNGQASRMMAWLEGITFRNGDIPMVNDAAWGIAPTTGQLRDKAALILASFPENERPAQHRRHERDIALSDGITTGYKMVRQPHYELLADVGAVGPDPQPGHAHADTFSFVLYVDNQPVIVDSGTSTYHAGPRRMWERGTAAHNTVDVMDIHSSEVWAGFRVGRRARVVVTANTDTTLAALHDGYRRLGVTHARTWATGPTQIQITDQLTARQGGAVRGVARLHFHPDLSVTLAGNRIDAGLVAIECTSSGSAPVLCLTTYALAEGFNRLRTAPCVEITFERNLHTHLYLTV